MCCLISSLFLLGPRITVVIWWLLNPARFVSIYDYFLWPILGILLLPWTTLAWTFLALPGRGGVVGLDWIIIVIAVIADISTYVGGVFGNRDRLPGRR